MVKEREDRRPSPDELLQKISKEANGKLTVFLGAVAGVGKTYTMLEAAHDRLAEGVNIVIGWVETHGRVETEKLIAGLPRIAPREIEYRDKLLQEMDIDAILEQKPDIVLVDELAHTNIPGSRHVRRFQDVEELINNGIHVYTTINIQHMESLNDIVAQITGVIVRETVPDHILEEANSIQLIDIPPEELIKRLKEGKVYIPGQAEQALKKFFRPGNINALRELSLRFTASRVDQDLAEYMKQEKIEGPWPASGRVMVCVSASPFSAQLIRAARRLAGGLRAELLAVHIETPKRPFPMGDKERDRVARNLRLAEELGGKTMTVVGKELTVEILDIARTHNVTAIVIGKPHHSRIWEFIHGSVVDTLIRNSGNINVYVIQGTEEKNEEKAIKVGIRTALPTVQPVPLVQYVGGLSMAAGITAVSWMLKSQIEIVNIALLYLVPVFFTAFWWGRLPSYLTALASVLAYDFLFIPPIFTFSVSDIQSIWSFVIFLLVSFFIGGRTELLRSEARTARQREKSIRALYDFSREIAGVVDLDRIVQKLASHMGENLGRSIRVLLPDSRDVLMVQGYHNNESTHEGIEEQLLSESEYAVAVWAYQHGQVAGRSTDTLPGGQYLYIPLMTGDKVVGIFGAKLDRQRQSVTLEERQLMNAWVSFAAIAVERVKLTEQASQTALLVEADKLRSALLNSISHELRTPLSTIVGAASMLLDTKVDYSHETRHDLLESIQEGSSRMERVVINLLDTARMENGMLHIKNDWCDIEDIIGASLRRIGEATQKYVIKTELAPELTLIRADFVLLEQVMVNLIDNAMKYSHLGSTIIITAFQEGEHIKITVLDNGIGIPKEELPYIFEKFYRVKQPRKIAGTGLGLSICKSIVEAHNGQIWAENRLSKGAAISFTVPIRGDGVTIPIEVGD
ncbi:ATP-binding protein [Pelosinus sp. sgz500959]|uniref:ATP-binding protein n=1 Tax=Pelosinus sp. sgz500959 TaxID=3242472 RepID=UPI0036716E4B